MITKASACSLVLTVGASAQNLRRVNCDGDPAAHFTDLPAAVAAASPGDTIWAYRLVSGSCTATFTAPVITKPLRIFGFLADPSGIGPTRINLRGPLVILGLGPGQRVEVAGFSVSGHNGSVVQDVGAIVAFDCPGELLLDNVAVVSLGGPDTFVHFGRCANVVVRGCEMILGGSPITCIDSSVLFTSTLVYHTPPELIWSVAYAATTEGLRVRASTVTLTGSVVRGSHRFFSSPNWVWRPGAVVESGQVRVGPASYLEGGRDTLWPGTSAPAYQILNPTVGSVVQDPRGTIGYPPMPPVGADRRHSRRVSQLGGRQRAVRRHGRGPRWGFRIVGPRRLATEHAVGARPVGDGSNDRDAGRLGDPVDARRLPHLDTQLSAAGAGCPRVRSPGPDDRAERRTRHHGTFAADRRLAARRRALTLPFARSTPPRE